MEEKSLIAKTKEISIVGFLRAIGIEPTKDSPLAAMYHAPYRVDRHPSFKVNKMKNRWIDFGTGKCGDIIDLGMLLYQSLNIMDVIRRIGNVEPALPINVATVKAKATAQQGNGKLQITRVVPLTTSTLLRYASERSIPPNVVAQFCSEIHFGPVGKEKYFGIGFENRRGGYEVRNAYFKGCIGPKDITIIKREERCKSCMLFEGFIDFLSYVVLNQRCGFEPFTNVLDCLVLNSVSCRSRALPYLEQYQTVVCCLDNDDAGRRTVEFLAEARDGVQDVSKAYEGYKDLNDYLCGKKFCP